MFVVANEPVYLAILDPNPNNSFCCATSPGIVQRKMKKNREEKYGEKYL
jgi:hypothetical protein